MLSWNPGVHSRTDTEEFCRSLYFNKISVQKNKLKQQELLKRQIKVEMSKREETGCHQQLSWKHFI